MTKQKEIREGIARKLRVRILGTAERTSPDDFTGITPWDELTDAYKRTHWLDEADEFLVYLDKVGVVIKVTQKYPLKPHFIYEPLIEESK